MLTIKIEKYHYVHRIKLIIKGRLKRIIINIERDAI